MSYSVIKKNYKDKKGKNKSERGFWEYSRFQKNEADINEQFLKSRCPVGNFDHSKINKMMYPTKSKEDIILEKYFNNEKLKSDENIIANHILEKRENKIKSDIKKIERLGLNAKDINTNEGRIIKLLLVAIEKIKNNDNDMIYYVHQRLNRFEIPDNIKQQYIDTFNEIEKRVEKLDKIKLQFTKFHSSMPPLDENGFNNLDPFQKEVIKNIDSVPPISTIVQAPTSSGKSILTGYLYTKVNMKALVIVPTDILAWQMSSMIGKIVNKDIPIITETFQSSPKRDILLEKINNTGIVVGTPSYILDFLPLINVKFDWLVVDEIHMIGHDECYEMEEICKAYSHTKLLTLSATIGNVEYLQQWFEKIGFNGIQVVKCEKRFFNLQQYYYSNKDIKRIHPISMISIDSFSDKSILNKNINVTPPDIFDLALKLNFEKNHELNPYNYFDQNSRITLDESNTYFYKLIEYMVYKLNKNDLTKILDNYSQLTIPDKKEKLINLAFTLKRENKTPAIIFQTDTFNCLEMVKQFSKDVKYLENKKHPDLFKKRLKQNSRAKSIEKQKDKMKLNNLGEKQMQKKMMNGELEIFENNIDVSLYEPHTDFIFNKHQKITQHDINKWNKELVKYFPYSGGEYHYIIDLLWRGVGIYVKGLPDPYLRIVQNLACGGELSFVFSDESLVFGVSMPFNSSVITKDNINSMMYHQMAGRAGRRGLKKDGNVIFINNSLEQIKMLSVSKIPNIIGNNKYCYGINFSKQLSENKDIWEKIKLNKLSENNESADIYYSNELFDKWEFLETDDKILNHMKWKLRKTTDCIKYPFLLTFIRKLFANSNPSNEKSQIDFAHFMISYTFIKETDNDNILEEFKEAEKFNIRKLMKQINIQAPSNIDRKIYECIRSNKLLYEKDYYLREDIINFSERLKYLQHYFYHKNEVNITRLIGKLLTRIWWIYHSSSPIMH